jgi:hypothetical protein
MARSLQDIPKKLGRPKTTGRGAGVLVRMQEAHLAALDAWIGHQPEPRPSRPEAIRRLAQMSLEGRQAVPDQSKDIAEEVLANSTRPRFSIDDVE